MTGRNRVALVGGVVAAVVGLAAAADPSLLALPVGEAAVGVLGAVALVYALMVLADRRASERRQATAPTPEEVPTVAPPGDDVDRLLAVAGTTGPRTADQRHRLRERLTRAAVRSIRRREDCGVEAAREALATGRWTGDHVAASYFTDGPVAAPADLPVAERVRLRLSRRARRAHAARRAADAVAALEEGADP